MNTIEEPTTGKCHVHPLAIISVATGIVTISVSVLLVITNNQLKSGILFWLPGGLLTIVLATGAFFAILAKKHELRGLGLCIVGGMLGMFALCFSIFAIEPVAPHAARARSQFNLKQIALGMHNYNDEHNRLPPVAIRDSSGTPLLSWRVAILPYVEEENLYKRFHLDEPWDSPHNMELLRLMPKIYYAPAQAQGQTQGLTYYRVFVGPGTAFERDDLAIPKDFPDGCSNTFLITEAGEPVPWTKPEELEYRPDRPLPPLGGIFHNYGWLARRRGWNNGFNAVTADAWARWFPRDTPEATIRAYITRNGGEKIEE
jgi:hypothetical protein